MSLIDVINKLKTEILPRTVDDGRFGDDKSEFIDFIRDEGATADQFQSEVIFGDVVMTTKNNQKSVQSVVIKVQPFMELPVFIKSDDQFYNEFLFYDEIVPFFRKYDSSDIIGKYFPKFFYGKATRGAAPREDILIFENLQKLGFKVASSRTSISYDHIQLTLRGIAAFHSLSLVSKNNDPDGFKKLISKIIETSWTDEILKTEGPFLRANARRGIFPLQNDPHYNDKLSDLFAITENMSLSMVKVVTPVEPLAFLCHGDFCRNNLLFRYDTDARPVDVKFFDLATIRFSSPVIDLSFFLFMNCSPEDRSKNWQDILETYHSAFSSNPNLNKEVCPTLEDIRQDFQLRGFYGYTLCSFFLPMMMEDKDKLEDKSEWASITPEDMIKLRLKTGGEKATHCVAQIVKHMIDEEFDFKYILNFKLKK